MRYLLWTIGLFAAAVALTTASHNPGYVLMVYPPYRVELSLTLFICLSILAFVAGYGLVRMSLGVIQLPSRVRKFRKERIEAKSRELLEEMLGAFLEGRYAVAEKAAAQAMKNGESSALFPVIAARSAHELREYSRRDAYLSAADGKSIGDTTMRLVTASKFLLDQHDPAAALKTLQQLRASGVKDHFGALSLELKAQQQAGNWDEVLKLLAQMEKREAIDTTVAAQLRQQAWLEKLRHQENLTDLTLCLKAIPEDLKRHSRIAAASARALIQHGGYAAALRLLTDSLNAQWDSELVELYGDCPVKDGTEQIVQAEKWLNLHQQDAGLLLAIGKLCLQQKLWGKAQSYLDASNGLHPSASAYTALGQLAERLGKSDDAFRYFQRAMELK